MQQPKCARPTCDRAIPGKQHQYEGLCFKHALAAGIAQHYQPADTAHDLVHRALSDGWSINEIRRTTGLNAQTITHIRDKKRDFIRHDTVVKLSSLPDQPPRPAAWPLGRRLQSLRAIGIPIRKVADDLGINRQNLMNIACGRVKSVSQDVDQMIRDYYRQHEMDLPKPVDRATKKAGHPTPIQWVDIDDPGERRGRLSAQQRQDLMPLTDDVVEVAAWLVEFHGFTYIAADSCGFHETVLGRIIGRRQPNVAREFVRRLEHAARRAGWFPGIEVQGVAA